MKHLTLVLSVFASVLLLCNGQTPGVTKCSAKMHKQGVEWNKLHADLLKQADDMRQQADDIYWDYFKGVSDAYGKEKDACPDPHDFNILNLSKVGIDDVLDKWQGPKLMGLPDFQKF